MHFSCLGDSLTAGYPGYSPTLDGITQGHGNFHSQYEYWLKKYSLEYIEEKTGSSDTELAKKLLFINKGIPGDTSTGLLRRINKDVFNFGPKPDYVIIVIGTNDLGWGSNSDKLLDNIKKLHLLSIEEKITPIGGFIPPLTKRATSPQFDIVRSDFNEELAKFFNKNEILFTTHSFMTDEEGYLLQEYTSGDGVHFSVAGYEKMGYSLFEEVLKKIINQELIPF